MEKCRSNLQVCIGELASDGTWLEFRVKNKQTNNHFKGALQYCFIFHPATKGREHKGDGFLRLARREIPFTFSSPPHSKFLFFKLWLVCWLHNRLSRNGGKSRFTVVVAADTFMLASFHCSTATESWGVIRRQDQLDLESWDVPHSSCCHCMNVTWHYMFKNCFHSMNTWKNCKNVENCKCLLWCEGLGCEGCLDSLLLHSCLVTVRFLTCLWYVIVYEVSDGVLLVSVKLVGHLLRGHHAEQG